MDAHRNLPRWQALPCARAISLLAAMFGAAGAAPMTAYASPTGAVHSFALFGSATLRPSTSVQTGGTLQLKATLAAGGSAAAVQQGAGYALNATLAAIPLVCTYDTIFQNGFDP